MGVGTRHQPHSARSFELALAAVGAARGRPWGGRLLPGCGASGVGRSPTSDCPPSGRAAGAHYPLAMGAGGVRAWGPVTSPTARALASWLCALWGRHEGARGGRLLPGCGASGVGRSPTPDSPPSGRAAGAHYPLAVGAGGCGRGDPSPTPQRVLFPTGFARCGGGTRAPGGGRLLPGCGASGVGRSPSLACPPSGRAAGASYPLAVGAGGCGRWDPSPTHSARSCELALRFWGRHEGAWGGPSCLAVGRPGSGALPPPTARPLGGLPGPTTHWLWVRGGAGVGTRHQPHSARSFDLALHAVGAARGRPGRGAACLGVGRLGSGALPPPTARHLGGLPGPTTNGLWVRGDAGVGTFHQPHSARSVELALRAVGAAGGRSGGGRLLPGRGASRVGRSPTPDCPPSGRAAGASYPLAVGAGGCGRWDPSATHSARSCELALRFGGGMRVPGGAPLAWLWGVRGRALSHPRLPVLWAGCRGPLPTGCGCGGVRAWGPVTNPTARALSSWLCTLWGWHEGARGGAPPAWVWGVWGRALSHPRLPAIWAGCRAHYQRAVGAGRCGRGDFSPAPQRALFRAGFARCGGGARAPGGGRLLPGCGASGVGRSPNPDCPPSGRAAGASYPLAVGAGGCGRWDPSATHSARSCELALRFGGGMRVPGGPPLAWLWGVRGRALSNPRLPAIWAGCRGPLPTGCGCGGMRGWGLVTSPTARALSSWLCALWGRREGARGGAPPAWVWGVRGRAPLPPPTARPLGGLPGPTTHWLWVRGGAGVGTRHQPHSPRSLELSLRAVGAARGRPGGGASCLGVGLPGSGALPPPTARPLGGLPGPATHWLWVRGGAGVGTRHQPTARALASWLCALGAA